MPNSNKLDYLSEVLKDCKFDEFSILGFFFIFEKRLAYPKPGDKTDETQDTEDFIGIRFNEYQDVFYASEYNNRYSQPLLDKTFDDITSCFKSFAYHLDIKLENDRLNIHGEKTETFNPEKVFELSKKDSKEIQLLKDYHDLYSQFLFKLGRVLSQCVSNYKESYFIADLYNLYSSENDQIGMGQISMMLLDLPPPLYDIILNPLYHVQLFDENGLKETRLLPFQIALRGFLQGVPHKLGEFVWNQLRLIFFQRDSHEPINTDFQFSPIKRSESLLDQYYEKIILPNTSYFLSNKDMIESGLNDIKSPEFKINDEVPKYDFIYSLIKKTWGFDVNEDQSISSNLTFFAIFYYCFICFSIINLKEK